MKHLPRRLIKDVIIQEIGDELLVYHAAFERACALDPISSTVFRACDGQTPYQEFKQKVGWSDEVIQLALEQLWKADLLLEDPASFVTPTRREVVLGLSAAALPVVTSLILPLPSAAASAPIPLLGACPSGTNCEAGLTCKNCFGCPAAPAGSSLTCCQNSNTVARGPGLTPSATCLTPTVCGIGAAQQCCSGTATFTVTNCGAPGTGTCICN